MDASEGVFLELPLFGPEPFGTHFTGAFIDPAMQAKVIVEQQIAGSLPPADQESGVSLGLEMMLISVEKQLFLKNILLNGTRILNHIIQ